MDNGFFVLYREGATLFFYYVFYYVINSIMIRSYIYIYIYIYMNISYIYTRMIFVLFKHTKRNTNFYVDTLNKRMKFLFVKEIKMYVCVCISERLTAIYKSSK